MKHLWKKVLCSVAILFSVSAVAQDVEINTKDPYAMVKSVADKTFARFHHDIDLIEANPDHLKVIVTDELMPYVDYKYAAYKVMGSYLRDSTPEQRERFTQAFKGYLIATYAQAFTEYTDQEVDFLPGSSFANEKIVDVHVQVIEKGRPPIKLQFRVRRLKDDTWKAFDLVAEGISLLSSKTAELTNLIRQKGLDEVTKDLEIHTGSHISLEKKEGVK